MNFNIEAFLPIETDGKINSVFVKANLSVLKKHQQEFENLDTLEKKLIFLQKIWLDDFDAEIFLEDNKIKGVQFLDSSKLMMFLMRHG